ncbi:MAG: U3 small nucleolar RNA-associated protein 13 [Alectoria sarmentosa]|nr:MAG: U3 small nucleolar RNA-associated protein 13 [Alectoria sarmentosa]
MSSRTKLTTTYDPERTIQPIYTGGDVALDREGRILATCLGEEALLTDLGTGELLARIEGDGEVLTALSLTPSLSHLIACSRSLSMKIYALQRSENDSPLISASLLRTLKPHTTPVITAAVDSTGTLLATGGADGVIKVWDIRGGYVTHTFRGHAGVVSALRFFELSATELGNDSKSNKKKRSKTELQQGQSMANGHDSGAVFRLASGSEDGKIRIWDLAKRKSVATLDSHVSVVRSLDYSADAHIFVSASRDKTAIVWDARTWKSRKVIPILEAVEAVGLLEEGTLIYAGGERGRVKIWNAETGREITEEQEAGGEGDGIVQILRNSSQRFLLSVHTDQSLILHSTAPLSIARSSDILIEPLPILRRISGTHDEIIDLAYVTPDRSLLALATNSEDIRLISLASSKPISSAAASARYFGADVAILEGHEDIIICLSVDWSGCWLATGAKDNTARLWRIDHASNSYHLFATFTGHAESIGAISLPSSAPLENSPERTDPLEHTPLFLLTGSQDRTIKRWNVPKTSSSSSRALYTRKAHDKDINAISLSPTSSLFASASQDRTVKIWSTEEGEVQGILRGHRRGVWSVVFAPKDTPPVPGENGSASSNRGLVLTGSGDKTVKIWSLNDYSCLRTLEGHTNSVLKVLWLPTTSSSSISNAPATSKRPPLIASAGGDGLLKVWDASTGEVAATLDNHTDRIWALTVNPDTGMLVSGGGDSVVTFWKDTSSETAAKTSAAATERVEQDQELQNYIHRGNYREAITLALALNHPARLLSLLQGVVDTQPREAGSISGLKAVDEVLSALGDEQLLSLLARARDWNTNARTCTVAQKVLSVVVRNYSAERLAGLGKRRGGREVVEALRVYTERHYRRIEELWGESWLVDFLLGEMEQLDVKEEGEDVMGAKGGGGEDVVMIG